MAEVLSRVFKVVLIIGLVWFGIWVLSQFGMFQMKDVVLTLVSCLPELSDVKSSYELGRKQSVLLKQQQERLNQQQKELDAAKAKLRLDQSMFKEEQVAWNAAHPSIPPNSSASNNKKFALNPTRTPDKKIKEYLSMLGQMRPKQAAAVIQKLPEETIFMIFDQLRRDQVIKIMENLPESFLSKLTMDRLNQYRDI